MSRTVKPSWVVQRATMEPMCPTPTMPSVKPSAEAMLRCCIQALMAQNAHWATAGALQPGALRTVMPWLAQ